jgi:hypothetical protein
MKIQYSKLIEYIDILSIFIFVISILITLINLFAKFLSPLFYNLIVTTFILSVTGFAVSDLYSVISQKNMKPATTESTSIFKLVFALIIFYLCSLGYGLFLFFGFFGYEDQAIFLSVLFFSGAFYFGYYRERNITKNNKNMLNKLGTVVKTLLFFAFYQ